MNAIRRFPPTFRVVHWVLSVSVFALSPAAALAQNEPPGGARHPEVPVPQSYGELVAAVARAEAALAEAEARQLDEVEKDPRYQAARCAERRAKRRLAQVKTGGGGNDTAGGRPAGRGGLNRAEASEVLRKATARRQSIQDRLLKSNND